MINGNHYPFNQLHRTMKTPWYETLWNAIRNKSTWTQIGLVLALVSSILPGVISPEKPGQYDDLVEYVEAGFSEGRDSVVVGISHYEELRARVEQEISWVTETGKRLWSILSTAVAMFLGLIGIGKAKRADAIMEAHEIDPKRPFDPLD